MSNMILNDSMKVKDNVNFGPPIGNPKSGIYAKTQVIGGYDFKVNHRDGISSLGEVVFSGSNMIPIGGTQRCFESLWGATGALQVPTLYDVSGGTIGLPNKTILDYEQESENVRYYIPAKNGDVNYAYIPYVPGDFVCLFGVGLTGSATNVLTKPDVNYLENSVQASMALESGREMTGVLLPFKYNGRQLSDSDAIKYFGKTGAWTPATTDPIGYYLKRFERDPEIKHFWKASSDDTEATNPVSQNEYYPRTNTTNSSTIESYVEMVLRVTTKDVKEWFEATDNIDATRINTIALYSGRYNSVMSDYENVRLFSKLTFNVVSLSENKDFVIIYRIFAS